MLVLKDDMKAVGEVAFLNQSLSENLPQLQLLLHHQNR